MKSQMKEIVIKELKESANIKRMIAQNLSDVIINKKMSEGEYVKGEMTLISLFGMLKFLEI